LGDEPPATLAWAGNPSRAAEIERKSREVTLGYAEWPTDPAAAADPSNPTDGEVRNACLTLISSAATRLALQATAHLDETESTRIEYCLPKLRTEVRSAPPPPTPRRVITEPVAAPPSTTPPRESTGQAPATKPAPPASTK
jgi:hypothetical protein